MTYGHLGEHLVDQVRRHVRHAPRHARRAKAARFGRCRLFGRKLQLLIETQIRRRFFLLYSYALRCCSYRMYRSLLGRSCGCSLRRSVRFVRLCAPASRAAESLGARGSTCSAPVAATRLPRSDVGQNAQMGGGLGPCALRPRRSLADPTTRDRSGWGRSRLTAAALLACLAAGCFLVRPHGRRFSARVSPSFRTLCFTNRPRVALAVFVISNVQTHPRTKIMDMKRTS